MTFFSSPAYPQPNLVWLEPRLSKLVGCRIPILRPPPIFPRNQVHLAAPPHPPGTLGVARSRSLPLTLRSPFLFFVVAAPTLLFPFNPPPPVPFSFSDLCSDRSCLRPFTPVAFDFLFTCDRLPYPNFAELFTVNIYGPEHAVYPPSHPARLHSPPLHRPRIPSALHRPPGRGRPPTFAKEIYLILQVCVLRGRNVPTGFGRSSPVI